MAKEKNKKEGSNGVSKKKGFFRDERVKVVVGVILIFASLFMTLAFISYLFTWKIDQSKIIEFKYNWKDIFKSNVEVGNWVGKPGAYLSYKFLNNWFGISSLVIPFIFFIAGLRLLKVRLLPLRRTIR